MNDAFARPVTAQAAVLADLRRRIGRGSLPPGAAIRQDRIADQLGVSRHPVREALRVLEGEGQIVHEPHRGYFVTELRLDALLEIYRMRDLLESEALRVSVSVADDELVRRMRAEMDVMRSVDPIEQMERFVEANHAFHFAPFEKTEMPRLLHHISMLWDASDAYRTLYYMQGTSVSNVHQEHADLLEAVTHRDVDAAIMHCRRHRDGTVRQLRSLMVDDA